MCQTESITYTFQVFPPTHAQPLAPVSSAMQDSKTKNDVHMYKIIYVVNTYKRIAVNIASIILVAAVRETRFIKTCQTKLYRIAQNFRGGKF